MLSPWNIGCPDRIAHLARQEECRCKSVGAGSAEGQCIRYNLLGTRSEIKLQLRDVIVLFISIKYQFCTYLQQHIAATSEKEICTCRSRCTRCAAVLLCGHVRICEIWSVSCYNVKSLLSYKDDNQQDISTYYINIIRNLSWHNYLLFTLLWKAFMLELDDIGCLSLSLNWRLVHSVLVSFLTDLAALSFCAFVTLHTNTSIVTLPFYNFSQHCYDYNIII